MAMLCVNGGGECDGCMACYGRPLYELTADDRDALADIYYERHVEKLLEV